ncbi:hypothetical protein BC832DRAFT_589708 [Gaertneriomyces semiglobifer]|nr:hypothetical protein BC832DRAFT_589708 [Gaertneriomyces semiglobifer]
MPAKLLPFHAQMLQDLLGLGTVDSTEPFPAPSDTSGDGLLIVAKGLGLRNVLLTLLQLYSDPRCLVLLLNTNMREWKVLREDLMTMTAGLDNDGDLKPSWFRRVDNENPASERSELYASGGVLAITSRILVVDLLNKVVPIEKVTGIIVNHAHRVTEQSTEAFILRLFRKDNKEGFIKAISDEPEQFSQGLYKLQRSLKLLYLRHAFLYPRFHMSVSDSVSASDQIDLTELRVPFTQAMKEIQAGLLDCIEQCLSELRRSHPTLDAEELTLENAFFKHFDQTVRRQLEPIWYRVSHKTKQLVGDLKILRKLLGYLVSYDCVSFHRFVEALVVSNRLEVSKSAFHSESSQSQWLLLDAAHTVLSGARQRVFTRVAGAPGDLEKGIPPGVVPVLEEQPKWIVLKNTLREIEAERKQMVDRGEVPAPVLIMVDGDRACRQIRDILVETDLTIVKRDIEEGGDDVVIVDTEEATVARDQDAISTSADTLLPKEPKYSSPGTEKLMTKELRRYFEWKTHMSAVKKSFEYAHNVHGDPHQGRLDTVLGRGQSSSARNSPLNKRRRTRGGSNATARSDARQDSPSTAAKAFDDEAAQFAKFLSQADPALNDADNDHTDPTCSPADELYMSTSYGPIPEPSLVVVRPYSSTSVSLAGSAVSNGEDDSRILEDLRPGWIVLYDPDVGFVRRVELYKATYSSPGNPLKVYFLVYESSVEEQRYLSHIRKEKAAFEKLIREKSIMAIPIDQDGRSAKDRDEEFWENLDTRLAGGRADNHQDKNTVIVDVREFRSALPSLLHVQKMTLLPCTLEVGDYILSPDICVERKSLSDLVSSLKSGRLYTQAEAMSLHYKIPTLLIEFDSGRKGAGLMGLGPAGNSGDIDSRDVGSKLCLLLLHFPNLRLIWSAGAEETAKIFEELKKQQEAPSLAAAQSVGVDNPSDINSMYSITPADILRSLPGITSKNYRHVMTRANNLQELSQLGLPECQEMLGADAGRRLFKFFRRNARELDAEPV